MAAMLTGMATRRKGFAVALLGVQLILIVVYALFSRYSDTPLTDNIYQNGYTCKQLLSFIFQCKLVSHSTFCSPLYLLKNNVGKRL